MGSSTSKLRVSRPPRPWLQTCNSHGAGGMPSSWADNAIARQRSKPALMHFDEVLAIVGPGVAVELVRRDELVSSAISQIVRSGASMPSRALDLDNGAALDATRSRRSSARAARAVQSWPSMLSTAIGRGRAHRRRAVQSQASARWRAAANGIFQFATCSRFVPATIAGKDPFRRHSRSRASAKRMSLSSSSGSSDQIPVRHAAPGRNPPAG